MYFLCFWNVRISRTRVAQVDLQSHFRRSGAAFEKGYFLKSEPFSKSRPGVISFRAELRVSEVRSSPRSMSEVSKKVLFRKASFLITPRHRTLTLLTSRRSSSFHFAGEVLKTFVLLMFSERWYFGNTSRASRCAIALPTFRGRFQKRLLFKK